jgi:hypothetical protein
MINRYVLGSLASVGLLQPACAYDVKSRLELEPLIVKHAAANNVPAALVHRIIMRESRYNPRAVGRGGTFGLMQIKHGTARALGYTGSASGLLDADTNLTYGVRYLAGAYRVANGDQNRAVGFYARGYYYDAKRRGMLRTLTKTPAAPAEAAVAATTTTPPEKAPAPSLFSALFAPPRPAEPTEAPAEAVVEEAAPIAATRSGRSANRRASGASNVPAASVEPKRRTVSRKAPVGAPLQITGTAMQPAVTQNPPRSGPAAADTQKVVRQGDRSARRSAASDADRSGQKASEQPGDPGRRP